MEGENIPYSDSPKPEKLLPLEDGWAKFLSEEGVAPESQEFRRLLKIISFLRTEDEDHSDQAIENEWLDLLSGLEPEEIRPYWMIVQSLESPRQWRGLKEKVLGTKALLIGALIEYYNNQQDDLSPKDRITLKSCAKALFEHDLFAVEEGGSLTLPLEQLSETSQIKQNKIPHNSWIAKIPERDRKTLIYPYDSRRLDGIGSQCFEIVPLGPGLDERRKIASQRGTSAEAVTEIEEALVLKIIYTDYEVHRNIVMLLVERAGENSSHIIEVKKIETSSVNNQRGRKNRKKRV